MKTSVTPDHASPGIGFERMVFFSDAVFAIAITLLVLDLRLPVLPDGRLGFSELTPKLLGFGVSFFVIALHWLAHHRLCESLARYDRALLRTNLLFLAGIAFLPFPTAVVTEHGDVPAAVILYAVSVATTGTLLVILAIVARRKALLAEGETRGGTVKFVVRVLASPIVFVASCFVAVGDPDLAMKLWLSLIPLLFLADRMGLLLQRLTDKATAKPSTASSSL